MKVATAVLGFVRENSPILSSAISEEFIDVFPNVEYLQVFARVRASDVAEVRKAAVRDGWQMVQLILTEGSRVETVDQSKEASDGMQFQDPALNNVRAEAAAKAILI